MAYIFKEVLKKQILNHHISAKSLELAFI